MNRINAAEFYSHFSDKLLFVILYGIAVSLCCLLVELANLAYQVYCHLIDDRDHYYGSYYVNARSVESISSRRDGKAKEGAPTPWKTLALS